MPRKPESTRRAKALVEIDHALDAVAKAITLLGGRVRTRSVKKNQRVFTARQYLESIDSRLHVCKDLLQIQADIIKPIVAGPDPEFKTKMDQMIAAFPEIRAASRFSLEDARRLIKTASTDWEKDLCRRTISTPQDDFEREYDATRRPQC